MFKYFLIFKKYFLIFKKYFLIFKNISKFAVYYSFCLFGE